MRKGDEEMGRKGERGKGRWGERLTVTLSPYHLITLSNFFLFLILTLAAYLRFHALDASSLWSDEGNTWALIQRPLRQIAINAAADIHPPGYYWLLKAWSLPFGKSAFAMRGFSAICGLLLVWFIYQIARQLTSSDSARRTHSLRSGQVPHAALLSAFLAAINPFQIYYSQEARMYMLLALESAGLMWALLEMGRLREGEKGRKGAAAGVYALCAAAGLWTHYSFPIVLLAAGLYWLIRNANQLRVPHSAFRTFLPFLFANLLAILAFLPWLPTALERIFAWPNQGSQKTFVEAILVIVQTLWLGPLTAADWIVTGSIGLAILLPLIGIWQLRHDRRSWLLVLWLLLPMAVMLGTGLFRDAYLKFLLVASPAWCLLAGAAVRQGEGGIGRRGEREKGGWGKWSFGTLSRSHLVTLSNIFLLPILVVLVSFPFLRSYYASPTARDNYQGVARYIEALGNPSYDIVVLDAPGQLDVWRYYDPSLPILALPVLRPADEAQTTLSLENATLGRRQVFALFWAMDEADPQKIVERWLDAHAFKGLDQWQGNLRFVTYAFANNLQCQPFSPIIHFGEVVQLSELCQPQQQQIYPGSAAIVGLHWQSSATLDRRYKVSLQLLDSRNQVIAQHDSEPGGGSAPTVDWQPNTVITDNHGIVIPAGVPPGAYRLIVALYDAETGARLPTDQGDFAEIGSISVVRPQKAIPLEIVPIDHRLNQQFAAGLTLVGYDLYERGFAHERNKPITLGAMAHVTLYWQAPPNFSPAWTDDQQFTLKLGSQTLTAPLAGGNYPTSNWQPNEFVRGEFDILFDGSRNVPVIIVGTE